MKKNIVSAVLIVLIIELACAIPILVLTPAGKQIYHTINPPPTPIPTPTPTPAPVLTPDGSPPTLHTSVAYLLDADTGRVLLDMQGEQRYPMASTTKIMTAFIALQQPDLQEPVTVEEDAVNEVTANMGSSAQLVVGDKISLLNLLYGLMLPSGDDAAIAIADKISGSPTQFVALMNSYAKKLHLKNTHYINPDGLTYYTAPDNKPNPDHYTTPADLAQLTLDALRNPLFDQIVQTQTFNLPATADHQAYTWSNTDNLLSTYPGALGIKTGSTVEAGDCLVFAATNSKHKLIGVILKEDFGAQGEINRFSDATALLNWGFNLPMRVPPPPPPKPTPTPKS